MACALRLSLSTALLALLAMPRVAQQAQPSGPPGTLRVLQSLPAPVSVAPATTSITIVFDRPVDLSTVNAQSWRVFGRYSGPHTGSFAFANGGRRITFASNELYSAGEV